MSTKVNIKKKAMIEALTKSLGVVTMACKQVGVDRTMHYRWLKDDPEYKRQVEDIEDVALDFAESKLHKRIEKEDTTATIFYLKTKGKKRGYIEKQEIDHSGIPPSTINVTVDTSETAETLKKLRDGS